MPKTTPLRAVSDTEAAEILGVARATLQDWRYRGLGPRYMRYSSRAVRYRISDLEDFMREAERRSTDNDAV